MGILIVAVNYGLFVMVFCILLYIIYFMITMVYDYQTIDSLAFEIPSALLLGMQMFLS